MSENTSKDKIKLLEVQVNHYKEMYENQREHNNKILTTIFWSLGTIAAFLILFVGANFFYSTNINEKQIESQVTEKFEEYTMNAEIYIDEYTRDAKKTIERDIENYTNETNDKLAEMNKELLGNKSELAIVEARYWKQEGIYENETTYLIEAINYGIERGYPSIHALRDLISSLEKVEEIDAVTRSNLAEMLSKLNDEYRFEREEIEEYLK